jgi:hypothetical protein
MPYTPFAIMQINIPFTIEYLIVGGGAGAAGSNYTPSFNRTNTGGGSGGGVVTGSTTIESYNFYQVIIGAGGASTLDNETGFSGNTSEFDIYTSVGGNGSFRGTGGTNPDIGGDGGDGQQAGFNGYTWVNSTTYAGGGGGGNGDSTTRYAGGDGGGGQGGNDVEGTRDGDAGTVNTGGGGGGASYLDGSFVATGNAGGSGVVIVRYLGAPKASGGTITESDGYTYHTFTSSGNLIT